MPPIHWGIVRHAAGRAATPAMLMVACTSLALIALTALLHNELIRWLTLKVPALPWPTRARLLLVVFATMLSHVVHVVLYGLALWTLVNHFGAGRLEGPDGPGLVSCIYFSFESYTSLGFGDIKPVGPVRMVTGVEALNGLVLIGWTACYLFVEAERLWASERSV